MPISKVEFKRWLADSTLDCHIAETASMPCFLAAKRRPPQGRWPSAVRVLQFAWKETYQLPQISYLLSLPLRPNNLVSSLLPDQDENLSWITMTQKTPGVYGRRLNIPKSPLPYEAMTAAPKLHPMGGHRPWWPCSDHGNVSIRST